jgi:3-deoxy-D-manno-octulosonic-acid transferase
MILFTALYRLAIAAYTTGVRIAAFFNPKAALFASGRKGLLDKMQLALASERRKRIWMHCASLGEFEQGRPVLEALRLQYPQHSIVLTFFSPSGYEVRKNYDGADYVFYLPMDTRANAAAFLDIVSPALCLFIKYEFWYFYLDTIHKRKIPAILLSAIFHKDQSFFKWYGSLFRHMLHAFSHIFVQDEHSKSLLHGIHISHVSTSGDTRFDRVIAAAAQAGTLPVAETFCADSKILVAGSTWPEDEAVLAKTLPLLGHKWKLILVPHEIHDEHIEAIQKHFPHALRWTSVNEESPLDSANVLIVDKVGLLMQLYRYGRVAWIGGGFGKEGVHNVLEAAVYGTPCLYGPIFHQFLEARELLEKGGAFSLSDPKEIAQTLNELDDTRRYEQHASLAKDYVLSKTGATAIVVDYIRKHVSL